MKILTFVVPSYHCASFLPKCITSLAHPRLLDQLEILIVNDGSTDDTLKVAEELEKQYPAAVRVISQENRGHGGALNTGCAAASGKYLKVIDADDWIETDNLPAFLKELESCEADVVLTHHYTRDISTGEIKKWKSYPEKFGVSYTMEQIMEAPRNFDRSLTFHGITYRTDFYRRNGMQLSEKVFYEDHEYATVPCCYAASVMPLDLFLYDYRIGDTQQSVSDANQLKRIGHTETVLRSMTGYYLQLPERAGKRYAAMKIQGLLLSYMTTTLLADPDRRSGRNMAKNWARQPPCTRRLAMPFSLMTHQSVVFFTGTPTQLEV